MLKLRRKHMTGDYHSLIGLGKVVRGLG